MVARRNQCRDPVWKQRRPQLADLRSKPTPEQMAAALDRAAGSWRRSVDGEKLLADIRWWRGHGE
ncbi:MAG TPA: hypothetical protein VFD32_19380 [Dehalococcoidia bacterium]|nr:hypothetical protein [Dehalococcoidia bacterium]